MRELPEAVALANEQRRELLARARAGDKESLLEAEATQDATLYDEVLNELA